MPSSMQPTSGSRRELLRGRLRWSSLSQWLAACPLRGQTQPSWLRPRRGSMALARSCGLQVPVLCIGGTHRSTLLLV